MITILVDSMCSGLEHWNVAVNGSTFHTDWAELQEPLDPAEHEQLARLILRAKCAGVPLNALGDLLLNGVSL